MDLCQLHSPKQNLLFFFFFLNLSILTEQILRITRNSGCPFGNSTLELQSNQILAAAWNFTLSFTTFFALAWILNSPHFIFQSNDACQAKRLGSVCGRTNLYDLNQHRDTEMNLWEDEQIFLAVQLLTQLQRTEFIRGQYHDFWHSNVWLHPHKPIYRCMF